MKESKIGKILWHDLTVPNAAEISAFYKEVLGWEKEGLDVGGYEDYIMKAPDGETVAGICNSRGMNAGLPAQWLMYVAVENLEKSLEMCIKNGGKQLGDKRKMGEGFYALIQDPAGAYLMLSEQAE